MLAGCAHVETAIRDAQQLAIFRSEISRINRDLEDLAQVLVYAGRIHRDDLANRSLDAVLGIIGMPNDGEKILAEHLQIKDIADYADRAKRLIERRSGLIQKSTAACLRLEVSVPRLYVAHRTLHFFTGAAIFFSCGAAIFLIFFFLRR
ncbi:MAG: hypothetical protein LBS68_03725 [Puniceicoccales bacterium]|nr:hypothetical protein [Puniceicoccales bacterium]